MTELQTLLCERCDRAFEALGSRFCVPCDDEVTRRKAKAHAKSTRVKVVVKVGSMVTSPNGIRGTIMGDHKRAEVTVHMENGEYAKLRCEAR